VGDKKRILVVDDEPDFCAIVGGNLKKEGFTVEIAYDGVEGLEKVKANAPDAILLDIIMPEKDGYAVCRELKADKKYAAIPIVFLTAMAGPFCSTRYSHHKNVSMEADDYLTKPSSAEAISRSLKGLLGMHNR
jgi:two-component system alkaline phosphatase synthesis response regulator PhoP